MKIIKLLVIGLSLMGTTAQAAEPISQHYVKPLLDRAQQAIDDSTGGDSADLFGFLMTDWMWQVASAFTQLSDTQVKIIERERSLHQGTTCLAYDLILLQQKMDDVRDAIDNEIKAERIVNITNLEGVIHFLNDRQKHILNGVADNNYEDPAAWWHHSFDEEAWCCPNSSSEEACVIKNQAECNVTGGRVFRSWQECSQTCSRPNIDEEIKRCPFDSDYLPPGKDGYGCHLNVLERIDTSIHPVLVAELEAARALDESQQRFLEEAERLQSLAQELAQLTGEGASGPGSGSEPFEYKRRISCNYDDAEDPENPVDEENMTDTAPADWPKGALAFAKRGPFRLLPDTFRQLQNFDHYLTNEARRREQAKSYKLPEEYPPGPERDAAKDREENELNIVQKILRFFVREEVTKRNIIQSREMAKVLVESHDANQSLQDAFKPLREAVKRMGELASLPDQGARLFMVNYGTYLQASCLYRPCEGLLKRLLEITMSDDCFPYTNGSYLDDPDHYQKCHNALTHP